ncbi:MAG: hypothetical protein ACRD4S_17010 [Candidatus Acidiferrales bacterium]
MIQFEKILQELAKLYLANVQLSEQLAASEAKVKEMATATAKLTGAAMDAVGPDQKTPAAAV